MNALVRGGADRFLSLPAFFREARGGLVDFLAECWRAVEDSDLVVFIPTTFFVAELARMRGIPSVRVALQPMFPTAKHATALFGSSDRGALINKLSYEIPRIAAPILWPGSLGFKAATGERLNVGVLPNPMTFGAIRFAEPHGLQRRAVSRSRRLAVRCENHGRLVLRRRAALHAVSRN